MNLVELRCTYSQVADAHSQARLVVDAELVEARVVGVHERVVAQETVARGAVVGGPVPWYYPDPAGLPSEDVAWMWGHFVTETLVRAVGEARLASVLEGAEDTFVRLVFRPADAATARIPFETLVWPPAGEESRHVLRRGTASVSVVREPARMHGTGTPMRATGLHRVLIISTESGGRAQIERSGRVGEVIEVRKNGFAGSDDELRRLIDETQPELIVLDSHGRMDDGMRVRSGSAIQWLRPDVLARTTGAAGAPVVLAMCGSGGVSPSGTSPTSTLVERGVPVAIGFQGAESTRPFVDDIVDGLLAYAGRALQSDTFSILDCERELARLRGEGPNAVTLVVHAAPAFSAGRRQTRRLPRSQAVASATPWYVPGQVVSFNEDGRDLRIPLPVDVGTRLTVAIGKGVQHSVRSSGGCAPLLTHRDVRLLADAWGFARSVSLQVTITGANGTPSWCGRAAELGALARAIAFIVGDPVPANAVRVLARAVSDGGAFDALPRVFDLQGRPVAAFPRWPAIVVSDVTGAFTSRLDPTLLPYTPLGGERTSLDAAFIEGSFDALKEIVETHHDALYEGVTKELERLIWNSEPAVVGPGIAALARGEALRPPMLEGAAVETVDAPDVAELAVR